MLLKVKALISDWYFLLLLIAGVALARAATSAGLARPLNFSVFTALGLLMLVFARKERFRKRPAWLGYLLAGISAFAGAWAVAALGPNILILYLAPGGLLLGLCHASFVTLRSSDRVLKAARLHKTKPTYWLP